MYKVYLTRQVEKEAKKQGKEFKNKLTEILQKLSFDPYPPQTERLSGELNFIYSYHFYYSGIAFRLAYLMNEEKNILTAIMIGPRENFYKILKQKIK